MNSLHDESVFVVVFGYEIVLTTNIPVLLQSGTLREGDVQRVAYSRRSNGQFETNSRC